MPRLHRGLAKLQQNRPHLQDLAIVLAQKGLPALVGMLIRVTCLSVPGTTAYKSYMPLCTTGTTTGIFATQVQYYTEKLGLFNGQWRFLILIQRRSTVGIPISYLTHGGVMRTTVMPVQGMSLIDLVTMQTGN